ncbi:MAG: hypothetical protein IT372_14355 [Polyangiaceae bacterium]|nr:hypothetical protein [Polyangiaceae bacterium]
MAVRTLDGRVALLSLLMEPSYTLSQLKAHPHGAPHVPVFEALRAEGVQTLLIELDVNEQLMAAQARVDMADQRLDELAPRVSKEVLTITHDNPQHPLHVHFFQGKTLGQFKRPVLSSQLEAMRGWQSSLEQSPHPALQALAPELAAGIAEADAAVAARNTARQRNRHFRDVGERKHWLDRLNAARKEVHGALAKLPHEQTGLPSNFADLFFLKDSRRDGSEASGAEEETVEALRAKIEEARRGLAEL